MTKQASNGAPRWRLRASDRLTLVSIFISALSFGFAIYALIYTLDQQRKMKVIDLLAEFQRRYDEVTYDVKGKVQAQPQVGQVRPEEYYRRYWDLQLEQHQYWKSGYITREIYSSWMDFRRREWLANEQVGGKSYQDGWQEAKRYLDDYEFSNFMERVFNGDRTAYINGPPKN